MQKGTPYIEQEEKQRICNFKGKIRSARKTSIVHMKRKRVCVSKRTTSVM